MRFWWLRFGPLFAAEIRKRRVQGGRASWWRWHLDEMFVKIKGERHYLWRAVDLQGEVLESFVTKKRDKKAALKFIRKSMNRYDRPASFVADKLRSYGAALKEIGAAESQETGHWLNNRAENSHPLPSRGLFLKPREGALSTKGAIKAALSARTKSAAIRRRSRLGLQPFQFGAQPFFPSQFQAEPRRRSRRVARTRRSRRDSHPALAETG